MELLLFISFGVWGGEKLSKKVEGSESNLLPRDIMLRVQEEKKTGKSKTMPTK